MVAPTCSFGLSALFTGPGGVPNRMNRPLVHTRRRPARSRLDDEQRRSWQRAYDETPFNKLPWYSSRPSL
jgi:hypothetical protein